MPWRDLYPFQSRYVNIGPHRLHYVERALAPPLLFVHGNPTWSFYWRNLILGPAERVSLRRRRSHRLRAVG